MKMETIDLGEATLAYRIDGEYGNPWLVLSNSLATNAAMWEPQMEVLTSRFRVLRYDTRGHGQSSAPPPPYALDNLTADVVALLNALAIERTNFMGLSLGGMTGIGLALDYPDRINRLICCDARADAPEIYQQMWPANIARAQQGGMKAVVAPTLERWFTAEFAATDTGARMLAATGKIIETTSVDGYEGCAHALMGLDFLPRLATIRTPSLFICGEHDAAAPVAVMQAMADAVPGASFAQIDDAAHLSNLQQPEAFMAAVNDWLG